MKLAWIHSKEFGEDICYYPDDLKYSDVVLGCGYETGKAYNITFNQYDMVEEIEEA